MNQLLYDLCGKPVIGVALWIGTLCGTSPIIDSQPVNLQSPGLILETKFYIPLKTKYDLSLNENPRSSILGWNYSDLCWRAALGEDIRNELEKLPPTSRKELGHIIPFHVVIKNAKSNNTILDKMFYSICTSGHNVESNDRQIAAFDINKGDYILNVYLEEPQPDLQNIKSSIGLFWPRR